jgi:hypothetical protein
MQNEYFPSLQFSKQAVKDGYLSNPIETYGEGRLCSKEIVYVSKIG